MEPLFGLDEVVVISGDVDRRREKRVERRAGGEVEVVLVVVGEVVVVVSLWPKRGMAAIVFQQS